MNPSKKIQIPLISVIMSVFNGESFLDEAIKSILNQTIDDFEFIIIDDMSTDKTLSIIERYQKLDPRIRVIMGKEKSLVCALNQGLDAARGKFIARMDADDIALPYRFERQLTWLEKTGSDITGSWIERFQNQSNHIIKARETDAAIKIEMLFYCPFKNPTVMMRTEVLKTLRYDSSFEIAEDYDLWARAAVAGWKMTNVQEVLLRYRAHSTQITSRLPEKQVKNTMEISLRYWKYLLKKMKLDGKYVPNFAKLFDITDSSPNLAEIEAVIILLIQAQTENEACDVLIDQLALQYMLAAIDSIIMLSRRKTIFSKFIWYKFFLFQLILWFIYIF